MYLLKAQHHVICYAVVKYKVRPTIIDRGREKLGTEIEYNLSKMG